jgi:UDP-N-acetylmuramyl pentapeptide phosphotransferase/UDP-N-acetylglucosamine-1-phosphate transferase
MNFLLVGVLAAATSCVLAGLLIKFCERAGVGLDGLHGVHKFHATATPRIGGVPIFVAFILMSPLIGAEGSYPKVQWLALLAALTIVCGIGLLEDLTQRTGPFARTLITAFGAAFASVIAGITLARLDIPAADAWLVHSQWLALGLTVVAVLGITHSVNLIDGYNGLLGFYALMVFLALAYVAFRVGDTAVLGMTLVTASTVLGFLFWNYPNGRIFLGDSGAYLLGFLQAEASILLVMRNPEVSAWFPMLLAVYPVTETFFSIYRKSFLRRASPWQPDGLHFHMMVYQRLVRVGVGSRATGVRLARNSMTSPYLAVLKVLFILPAILFWQDTFWLMAICALFVVVYVVLYWRLVRFRAPKWLILERPASSFRDAAPGSTEAGVLPE